MLALGAAGMVNAVANVAPARVASLYEAIAAGKLDEGRRLHYELLELNRAIFYDTNPIPLKYMLKRLGHLDGQRPPPPDDRGHARGSRRDVTTSWRGQACCDGEGCALATDAHRGRQRRRRRAYVAVSLRRTRSWLPSVSATSGTSTAPCAPRSPRCISRSQRGSGRSPRPVLRPVFARP